ncbi:hypothetical protein CU669_08210 [Paramagnetospirillum kuznetsovii]|uniref:DUF922 domain-containing protein n=2 Tax=Paramagnetospirillum kuznetsovii TaxID=2053833 RepID=A0A364P079_9PROT|nr:hypothetical protein CU669_08210 [Paramagnetospirillum kuznetsovii]
MGIPVYSGELSRVQVNALAHSKGTAGNNVIGLTQSEVEGKVTTQIWSVDMGGGRRCQGLGRVDGHWRLKDIVVHIASEYPPGGCNYAKIRQHEDEHVAIARETFQRWAPRLQAALGEAASRERPMLGTTDPNQMKRDINERLLRALQPTVDGYKAELKSRNAAIDTTANYRLVMSRCPGW